MGRQLSTRADRAIWIRRNFPDLFYIVNPGGYDTATWIAFNQFVPGIDNETISNGWLAENIQQGHGPLVFLALILAGVIGLRIIEG